MKPKRLVTSVALICSVTAFISSWHARNQLERTLLVCAKAEAIIMTDAAGPFEDHAVNAWMLSDNLQPILETSRKKDAGQFEYLQAVRRDRFTTQKELVLNRFYLLFTALFTLYLLFSPLIWREKTSGLRITVWGSSSKKHSGPTAWEMTSATT